MSHYRKIDVRIWNDAKFNALSDNGKLCFFLLLTHPHMTALGAMRGTPGGLADELGWSPKAFREAFLEALEKGIVKHDPKACLIWLPNFLKYNRPESPNVVSSWHKALDLVPECPMKNQIIQHVKSFVEGLSEGFLKALPEGFAKAMPNQEQEQEQEQEKRYMSGTPENSEHLLNGHDQTTPHTQATSTITRERRDAAKRVLEFLNQRTGRNYQPVEANIGKIEARLKDGATEVQCRQVIVRKWRDWHDDDKMSAYLRPATLFNREKFAQYQGELVITEEN